jgi:hypothetical protein
MDHALLFVEIVWSEEQKLAMMEMSWIMTDVHQFVRLRLVTSVVCVTDGPCLGSMVLVLRYVEMVF